MRLEDFGYNTGTMIHLFIDTNVYLTFFSLAADDLEELKKLRVAIDNHQINLWLTDQVLDEFKRNREAKIAESLKHIKDLRPSTSSPAIARNLPEFTTFVEARKEFDRTFNSLSEKLLEQIEDQSLAADEVIAELFGSATQVEITDQIFEAALRRSKIGNPPGKKKHTIGDEINWECLLAAGPDMSDLHVVSGDGDFSSLIRPDRISEFLEAEWGREKGRKVFLYSRLSEFFKEQFPGIELASEFEKELCIRRLIESDSFESTHRAIARLGQYSEYTDKQARDLLDGCLMNPQIRWIASDPDVSGFFLTLMTESRHAFSAENIDRFCHVFEVDRAPEPDNYIPF